MKRGTKKKIFDFIREELEKSYPKPKYSVLVSSRDIVVEENYKDGTTSFILIIDFNFYN